MSGHLAPYRQCWHCICCHLMTWHDSNITTLCTLHTPYTKDVCAANSNALLLFVCTHYMWDQISLESWSSAIWKSDEDAVSVDRRRGGLSIVILYVCISAFFVSRRYCGGCSDMIHIYLRRVARVRPGPGAWPPDDRWVENSFVLFRCCVRQPSATPLTSIHVPKDRQARVKCDVG